MKIHLVLDTDDIDKDDQYPAMTMLSKAVDIKVAPILKELGTDDLDEAHKILDQQREEKNAKPRTTRRRS